jgi:molybdopterin molybdotransferase
MRGFQDRANVDFVQALLAKRLKSLPAEMVGLHDAAGRVLASAVSAEVDVPAFDRAAMDGFALRGQETFGAGPYNPLELEVIGSCYPGRPFSGCVGSGQAVRIMTGAPLPAGADAVLQAESAEEIPAPTRSRIRLIDAVPPGRNVGHRGEDIEAGSIVFRQGRMLRPQDVGVLASIGKAPIAVIGQPTVSIIATGDELLPCGSRPEGHRIVDSNSVMLEALVRRDGGIPRAHGLVPDRRDALRQAIMDVGCDILLISGGSSVGEEDHAPRVLAEIGELCVHGVALRPASPAGLGFLQERPVFLLPGNPVSCLCAYDLFAGMAVRQLGGRPGGLPHHTLRLPLAHKISSAVGRVDYVRVQVSKDRVEPLATGGASILSSTCQASGFVLVPRDSEGHAAGDIVTVYLYDS